MIKVTLFTTLLFESAFAFADSYSFTSNFLYSVFRDGQERTLLEGDVVILSEDKEIRADKVEIFGENFQYFLSEGNVRVRDTVNDLYITSGIFYYDNEKKVARVPGPSVVEDRSGGMVIKSNYLEFREADDIIILQVGVRIIKDDLVCRSEYAVFNRKSNLLDLTGLPVVYRGSDVFRAAKIIVNTESEEINMEGEVQGSLALQGEEEVPPSAPDEAETPGVPSPRFDPQEISTEEESGISEGEDE